jgi:ABC-type siderophore export system fused ATPase/permease subunit
MRKIEVIFSQADKELVEKLRRRYKKLADIYLALVCIFKIITVMILCGMIYFMTLNKSSYAIAAVWITFMSAIISLLISYVFQMMHDNCFVDVLHYQFMSEHMQEISEFENSLTFSVSKSCPDTVTYNLPDCRCRYIEAINNIPADGNVIITVKEDVDAKNQISLNWYAKTV